MSDHIEHKCYNCGSLLIFKDGLCVKCHGTNVEATRQAAVERYFVMLSHPAGYPVPIVVGEDDNDMTTMLYDSRADAEAAMRRHFAAQAWGYDVYPWPRSEES